MKQNLEKRNDLMYYEGTDKLADGHFEHHNEDGSLFCQYSLKEGKYDGVCTFYWSNGNTAHEAFFEDGGCSGEIFFYYPNGQIQAIEQFKNNVRHGLCAQFSEDGTIVFNSRYEDGEEVHNEGNSKLHYLLPLSKKRAYQIYKTCTFIIKFLDQLVEAIMTRTIYRLSDRQKNVIMNILLLVGVGVVNELFR